MRYQTSHVLLPAVAFVGLFAAIMMFDLDRRIADALFFRNGQWLGAHTGWADRVIHTGGRDLVRLIAASALAVLIATRFSKRLRPLRREAAFVTLAIVLSVALVGVLKHVTNVDCPWSLAGYGGVNPYIPHFTPRPDFLPAAACFPGAHSSSGFALVCFYFVLRGRAAKVALAAALVLGALFAFGQEARGAHFLSHDLTSLGLVWGLQLALSRAMLRHGSERPVDLALQHRLTV